ncbi:DNA-binding MarR family transcriptional regulator [Mumia flava]|uniref:DNA-binding MarR family transcriptional regulator n=1 Tax=Mumia flava TaxID=1348852 RepID=A0A0B2BW14_9ACTN|nr:MarR family transcriptional regulator [Mumia flava]PJJ54211.1 DNA-binding MarR family transcriptional regulator [Mumia flava]
MTTTDDQVRWLSPEERAAWLAVAALIVKLPNALDAQLQHDQRLSFFEYMILAVLSEQDDHTLQMSDIAEFTSGSLSRLSHTVTRLEREGLVTRERMRGPGRRTCARLTDAGYAKVVAAAPGHVERVREVLIDAVTPEQLDALRGIGEAVLARIDPDRTCTDGRV